MAYLNIFPSTFLSRIFAKNTANLPATKAVAGPQPAVMTLRLSSALTHRNYLSVIEKGEKALKSGVSKLELDFAEVEQITMAGLFALYSLSLLNQGCEPPAYAQGRAAINQMAIDLECADWDSTLKLKNLSVSIEQQLRDWKFL